MHHHGEDTLKLNVFIYERFEDLLCHYMKYTLFIYIKGVKNLFIALFRK